MKKWLLIIIFLFILIFVAFIAYPNYMKELKDRLTGKIVTGEATDANLAISIFVSTPPGLTLIKPENETYITNKSLDLQFVAVGEDYVWYNLNQLGSNITITGNTTFNATEDQHTLYLYANNSNATVIKNMTFSVNLSKYRVIYNEYAGSTRGSSTDFNKSSYEDLQNLSNIVLENTGWGKILFNEIINVTDDADLSDNEIDLDTNTNISENLIEINLTALPNLNKSATLYLYNLTFSDPRILKDGEVCPSSICTRISYSGGTLIFNVTQFTIYSAEESPVTVQPPGGGGGLFPIKSFALSTDEIKVKLKQGESILKSIIIANNGNQKLSISIENPKLKDFLKISEESFDLNAGESKSVVLDISAGEETIPDLYLGKLIIKGDGLEKEILVAIEVESKKALFDVKVEIFKKFRYVLPGEEIFSKVEIFNLGDIGKVDASIEHIIMDEDGDKIISEQETKAIETSISYIKEFKIPEDVKFGRYVLYVKVTHKEQTGSASTWFNVSTRIPIITLISRNLTETIISILVLIIIILIIRIYRSKKKILRRRKEENLKYYKNLEEEKKKI